MAIERGHLSVPPAQFFSFYKSPISISPYFLPQMLAARLLKDGVGLLFFHLIHFLRFSPLIKRR